MYYQYIACSVFRKQLYSGLPVCAIRERVNRYTVSLSYMLTCSDYYGNMVSVRKRLRTALEPGEPGPQ